MTTECEKVLASSLNSNIGITNGGDADDHKLHQQMPINQYGI